MTSFIRHKLKRSYEILVAKKERGDGGVRLASPCFRLNALKDLRFLDWHACSLLVRSNRTPLLLVKTELPPLFLVRRIAAHVATDDSSLTIKDESDAQAPDVAINNDEKLGDEWNAGGNSLLDYDAEVHDYEPGAILDFFIRVPGWSDVWHNYLTSRDVLMNRTSVYGTIGNQFPHVRTGFITGVELFNRGEYYEAHEDWESLWMRLEEGAERSAAQGLIQLAGAHIHRLKNRRHEARKLFASAHGYLACVSALNWLDTEKLIEASAPLFSLCDATDDVALPSIPLHNSYTTIARKHR